MTQKGGRRVLGVEGVGLVKRKKKGEKEKAVGNTRPERKPHRPAYVVFLVQDSGRHPIVVTGFSVWITPHGISPPPVEVPRGLGLGLAWVRVRVSLQG